MEEAPASVDGSERLTRVAAGILGGLFLAHFIVLATYAVNVPHWDEWDMLPADLRRIDWGWLFSWSNEHRPVLTRLEVFLSSRWGGWNVVTLQLVHFVFYGLLVLLVVRAARKAAPELPGWAAYGFSFFLLSAIAWEVHSWAATFCWTLSLFFFVIAAHCLFHETQGVRWLVAGASSIVVAFFSNDVGLVAGLSLAAWFALFKLTRAWRRADGAGSAAREIGGLGVVLAIVGTVLLLAFHDYRKPLHHPALAFPDRSAFWTAFTNVTAHGFGFATRSVALGLSCLALALAPVAVEFWRRGLRVETRFWRSSALTLGIVGALAGIAVARGGFGPATGKESRYAFVAIWLVPFTATLWSMAMRGSNRARALVLAGLWAFCFLGFADDWNAKPYRHMAERRRLGLECVREYYTKTGDGNCPAIYPAPIAAKLDLAARLHLSFYEDIRKSSAADVASSTSTAR